MSDDRALLDRSLLSGRVHSAYLLAGSGEAPRNTAERFARAAVCELGKSDPCETCNACRRSSTNEPIELDGTGKAGPLYRHIGDHADLLWVERGPDDTRVRIGQIRAIQHALRLRPSEGGRKVAVLADAEWLNAEAQNALLRLLEEPPAHTTLVLVTKSASSLLATVRSRCQRVVFRDPPKNALDDPELAETVVRLQTIDTASVPDLLDWAEDFRGPRAEAASAVEQLLAVGAAHLRHRVQERVARGDTRMSRELDASRVLSECRKSLVRRNANPQMVAERALFAIQVGSRT